MPLLKPVPGRLVPDPDRHNDPLPPEGRAFEAINQYWARRIRDNDVILSDEPEPTDEPDEALS